MKLCWKDVTGPASRGTTVDTLALGCQEGRAMTARPPGECNAPTTKSSWPPKPEKTPRAPGSRSPARTSDRRRAADPSCRTARVGVCVVPAHQVTSPGPTTLSPCPRACLVDQMRSNEGVAFWSPHVVRLPTRPRSREPAPGPVFTTAVSQSQIGMRSEAGRSRDPGQTGRASTPEVRKTHLQKVQRWALLRPCFEGTVTRPGCPSRTAFSAVRPDLGGRQGGLRAASRCGRPGRAARGGGWS